MKQFLFVKFLSFLESLTNKKIVYFPKNRGVKNLTAVKSDLGFWYAGNVLDMSDIAYGVLYNGSVEPDGSRLVVNILKYLLSKKPQLAFYDIGANTGYFGVLAAFVGSASKIVTYAFEPVEDFSKIELETFKLNRLEEVCKVFNIALGETVAEAELFLAGSGSSLSKDFVGNRGLQTVKVQVCPLDKFISDKNLNYPDFIKIDVEGHEFSVLKGAEQTIKKTLPVIWYESALTINATKFKSKDFFATQDFLKNLGYEVFYCGKTLITTPKENIADGVGMYLALHKQAHQGLLMLLDRLYENS